MQAFTRQWKGEALSRLRGEPQELKAGRGKRSQAEERAAFQRGETLRSWDFAAQWTGLQSAEAPRES